MAADRITGESFATRSEVLAPRAMAATSQPLATQAALEILRGGGNAVDAAIGANACLGLMEPVGAGIGGDLFAILWDAKTARLHGLNASGRSARGASAEEVKARLRAAGRDALPFDGPLSVSLPGAVDGWFALHGRFGRAPMAAILAPAIRYAEEGHPVSEVIAHYWQGGVEKLGRYAGFKETFTIDGHRAPREGELWRNRPLARTYRQLVEGGRDAFYRREMARTMAACLEAEGSFLRLADFEEHEGEWVDPVSTRYRGHEVWELPPNGQGIAALQILNLLEAYDLAAMGWNSADYVHCLVEAKKLAYEDRARLYGDPAFGRIPVERLISKTYAARRRALIDPARAALEFPADPEFFREGDTVYLCVADAEGNMVSLIQSNYAGMGAGVCPPGLGFGFQNRGCAFNFDAGHPNAYAPGKRPFHTIIPAFVTREGAPVLAFGVMGGDMQPQGHVQILVNWLDFQMNLQEAGDAPRIYHTGSSEPEGGRMKDGGELSLERGFDPAVVQALAARGHRLRPRRGPFGGFQGIWRNPQTGVYHGASESRKDGQAAGF